MTIHGNCHCGAVAFEYRDTPEHATECNCSACRRLGALWIYSSQSNITITAPQNGLIAYSWGDRDLVFHTCRTCGATVDWRPAKDDRPDRMAVNLRLAELDVIRGIRVRLFDGAESWEVTGYREVGA
jgi:hypothetical protein